MIMGYVAPNSEAHFFKGTGLTPSYTDSLYFSSESAKNSHFDSLGGFVAEKVTYQRENINRIRVECNIANLYNCDYMRFKNTSFENKWFYAFVLEINYINNVTTEVIYQLDPLMTWMGTFSLKKCYVVRQHTVRDGIGNNICAEDLPTGPYITEKTQAMINYQPAIMKARIAVARGDAVQTRGGIMSGTVCYDCDSSSEVYERLNQLVNENMADSIVSITMIPSAYTSGSVQSTSFSDSKPYSSLNGYVPRNKKLFCYPYKYLQVDNDEGDTATYAYEYFNTVPDNTSSGNYSFEVSGCGYATGAEVMIRPNNYKANSSIEFRMMKTHFPQCAFAIDSYQAYLAQRNAYLPQKLALNEANALSPVQMSGKAYSGLTGAIGSLMSGNYTGAFGSLVGGAANATIGSVVQGAVDEDKLVTENLIENQVQPEAASHYRGTGATDIMYSTGRAGVWTYQKCITKNYAMMLDDYFDAFGYAVKQVMTPNMNARPYWTYVKTVGCSVGGNLPAKDKHDIESIFDSGVRFWKSISQMGNYSLDNRV